MIKSKKNNILDFDKRHKLLFETANDSIFIMDKKIFIDCNSKTLKIFGCKNKGEILYHSPINFSPTKQPDGTKSSEKAKKYIKAAFNGKPQDFYWKHSKKNGDLFDARVSLKKLMLDGKPYLQAIVRDISKEMEAQQLLQESEDKFKTVVTNAQAIIFVIDQNGNFLLSEGRGLSVLGLKPGQVVGSSALEMYRDYPEVIKGIKDSLKGKYAERKILVQGIYFDIFFSPFMSKDGPRVIGMAIDVTEEEEAKIKLQEIDKVKTDFLTTASHQLRSPLGAMRWSLESLIDDEDFKKYPELLTKIKDIHNINVRSIKLVGNLLNVSKIEQGKTSSKPENENIINLIEEIIKELEMEIDSKKIDLNFIKDSEKIIIKLDKQICRESIQNLISNAIKYNKINGKILIIIKKVDNKIKIDIANTGIIIPQKDQHRMFEKFFRSDKAITSETDGSGLGLFVSKYYIEKRGGTINFTSPAKFGLKSLGGDKFEGTIFSITLPIKIK